MAARRMLLIALMLWSAESAAASPWEFILASPNGLVSFYGDPKSLVVQGPIRRVRLLYDYKQAQQDPDTRQSSRSQSVLVSVDCVDHKFGTVQETKYADSMAQGAVVGKSKPMTRVAYKDVTPDSMNEKMLQYACALKYTKGKK